ncbi:glycosyltransferase [Vibrio parahaemolyticus]|uniref:glycosyltransferase n=1 Tax=Vibrio sp. Y20_XG_PY13 TaxID=2957761 RepID=UPI0020A5C762|nr:glycosyltransferase [Vibrio sp. Y20_XG_PY13]
MKKKKILLIIPKLYNGGIEKVASVFSLNLCDDYDQYIYSIMNQDESYDFAVKPIILERRVASGYLGKLLNFFYRIKLLRDIVHQEDIDVVISFGERCNLINMISFIKVKRILTIHSVISVENKSKGFLGFVGGCIARTTYSNAEEVVAVSGVVKDEAEKYLGISNISKIYNGHEIDSIIELGNFEADYKIEGDYIVAVGRITYAKGYWHLIRCFSKLKLTNPNLKLVIVGGVELDGRLEDLKEIVSHFKLESEVQFLGQVNNPYPIIKNAKLLALTSIYEGLPGVAIESLSLGTPVVSTNSGGSAEIVLGDVSCNEINLESEFCKSDFGCITKTFKGDFLKFEELTFEEQQFCDAMQFQLDVDVKGDNLKTRALEFAIENAIAKYRDLIEK